MCVEDIRIGRRLNSASTQVNIGTGVNESALGPRPDRLGVSVSWQTPTPGVGDWAQIGWMDNGTFIAAVTLTPYAGSCYMSVRDYGTALLGNIAVGCNAVSGPLGLQVTDYFLTTSLDDV